MRFTTLTLATVLSATLLTGCVVALGNKGEEPRSARFSPPTSPPTLGRQLSDLKQARDSGALTEEEYQLAKKRLIDGK